MTKCCNWSPFVLLASDALPGPRGHRPLSAAAAAAAETTTERGRTITSCLLPVCARRCTSKAEPRLAEDGWGGADPRASARSGQPIRALSAALGQARRDTGRNPVCASGAPRGSLQSPRQRRDGGDGGVSSPARSRLAWTVRRGSEGCWASRENTLEGAPGLRLAVNPLALPPTRWCFQVGQPRRSVADLRLTESQQVVDMDVLLLFHAPTVTRRFSRARRYFQSGLPSVVCPWAPSQRLILNTCG